MAAMIMNTSHAIDDDLDLSIAALRRHALAEDLLDWLDETYPHHFFCQAMEQHERIVVSSALREMSQQDTGGSFGPANKGFPVLVAWLANTIRKIAENRW
jgi:hypothetical protein